MCVGTSALSVLCLLTSLVFPCRIQDGTFYDAFLTTFPESVGDPHLLSLLEAQRRSIRTTGTVRAYSTQ